MPIATIGSLHLYYEIYGENREETLVLINGLGSDHREWLYQLPDFKEEYRVVVFDNRGTGVSDIPPGPYTTEEMAGDLCGLMDYLDIGEAHVLGVSMGGLIAQKFAVHYSKKVSKLVLACTGVGGEESIKPGREAIEAFRSFDDTEPEESLQRVLPYLYTKECIDRKDPEVDRFIRFSLQQGQNLDGYMSQLGAIGTHSSFGELGDIDAETLVITGGDDLLIPPENSSLLSEGIANARLLLLEGAPHRLFAESWREFNRSVLEFLGERGGDASDHFDRRGG